MRNIFYAVFLSVFSFTSIFAQFEEGRVYSIESRSTGRFLRAKTSNEITFEYSGAKSEWFLIDNGDTTYQIKNSDSNEVLAVENASTLEDAKLSTEDWLNTDSQKWYISASDYFYSIKNVKSGLVLTAMDELPIIEDNNPDVAYFNSYSSIGKGVQKSDTFEKKQQFHIAPIKHSREEALVVPQLGWKPIHKKEALLISNSDLGTPIFEVLNKDDQVILAGNMQLWEATSTWDQFYYKADLTALSNPGTYKIQANGFTTSITIDNDIFRNPKYNKGGTLTFSDYFNGFWKYNGFYSETQTLPKASLELVDGEDVFTENGTFDVEPYGWFDAHSRDSKLGRTAKAISDMCLAHQFVSNSSDRLTLETEIRYGLQQLLLTQNADGSCPAGRIREPNPPRTYYYWTTNVDVNTTARTVKAYAIANQIFKETDSEFAASLLTAAQKAWQFVVDNETLVDENLSGSWKGATVDILTAAIEMARATEETAYFEKADEMFNEARFTKGYFYKESGSFPFETNNIYASLDVGSIPFLCRYLDIARTDVVKTRVKLVLDDFTDFWLNKEVSPFGFPQHPLDRMTAFGNVVQVARYAYSMLAIANYTDSSEAYNSALSAFNFITGYNPFATSYIVGIGDSNITPSANYFKRSYEDGIGSFLPGFTNDGTTFTQNFSKYQVTEGVVPVNSTLFFMLSCLDSYSLLITPKKGDLIINKVKSHENNLASWVQIYNPTNERVILDQVVLEHYRNEENNPNKSIQFSGVLGPKEYVIVSRNNDSFESIYGFIPDYELSGMYLNQNTDGLILRDDNGILDQLNDVPLSTMTFKDNHLYLRNGFENDGTDLANSWCDLGDQLEGIPTSIYEATIDDTTEDIIACNEYTWSENGLTYTTSGTYISSINCGSNAILNLTITYLDNSVTQTDISLIADAEGVSYQWFDCNSNEVIEGETNQSFIFSENGNYGVEISNNDCSVTSACYNISTLSNDDIDFNNEIKVYPNPTSNIINIDFGNYLENIKINIRSVSGVLLKENNYFNRGKIQLELNVPQGLYFIEVISNKKTFVSKIVKQ